jgi:hypothetical protein
MVRAVPAGTERVAMTRAVPGTLSVNDPPQASGGAAALQARETHRSVTAATLGVHDTTTRPVPRVT